MKNITSSWTYYKCLGVSLFIAILLYHRILDFKPVLLDFFLLLLYGFFIFLFVNINMVKYGNGKVKIYSIFKSTVIDFSTVTKLEILLENISVDILHTPSFIEFKVGDSIIKRRYFLASRSGHLNNFEEFRKLLQVTDNIAD